MTERKEHDNRCPRAWDYPDGNGGYCFPSYPVSCHCGQWAEIDEFEFLHPGA